MFDWTFANLHVKLLFGVRFCSTQSEWLHQESPNASGLGPTSDATLRPFIPGVALSKKILDLGLAKLDRLSRIADAACVSRRRDEREEAE
jgi:hypothetical protein